MFPKHSKKTYISLSLSTGTVPEPGVSNEAFLSSYLDYACWLRVVQGRQLLAIVENPKSTEMDLMAAIASFYQTAGVMVEDALTMYVAWSLWSKDKSRLLADILERLSVRLAEPKNPLTSGYVAAVDAKFAGSEKAVNVYPRLYLSELLHRRDNDLPGAFGIEWKRRPSVKLVPLKYRAHWDRLGYYIRGSLEPLINPKGHHLASCYNKIKHGPQLIAMAPSDAALARGFPPQEAEEVESKPLLRLLLAGSRTQENAHELSRDVRVAPFLVPDPANTRRWYFQQIVHTSNALFVTGTWLFNSTYKEQKRQLTLPPGKVRSIIEEQANHNEAVFGIKPEQAFAERIASTRW